MRKYLQDGQGWTDDTFQSIDWDNFETAITEIFKSSKTDFSCYIKFMIDMANTGTQKEKIHIQIKHCPNRLKQMPVLQLQSQTSKDVSQGITRDSVPIPQQTTDTPPSMDHH